MNIRLIGTEFKYRYVKIQGNSKLSNFKLFFKFFSPSFSIRNYYFIFQEHMDPKAANKKATSLSR